MCTVSFVASGHTSRGWASLLMLQMRHWRLREGKEPTRGHKAQRSSLCPSPPFVSPTTPSQCLAPPVYRKRYLCPLAPPLLGQGTINDLPKLYAKFLCNEDTRAENSLNIQLTTMQTGPQLNISCFHKFTSSTKLWFKPKTANLSKWWWKTVSRKLGD